MLERNLLPAVIACLFFIPLSSYAAEPTGYAGAAACKPCHQLIYDDWSVSGHASILRKATDPRVALLPLPAGFARRDISYVVGGYRWKALFLDKNGYVITSTTVAGGKNQYNVKSQMWSSSLSGKQDTYDCGRCHTTGYLPIGHQASLPGIIGTWQFDGVQCEACHGPGSRHVQTTRKVDISTNRNICNACHETQPRDIVPVSGVFLAPYTESNQLMKSAMKDTACIECHDPHRSALASIQRTCESCHKRTAEIYADSYLNKVGVTCIDCHMPPAGLLAEGNGHSLHRVFLRRRRACIGRLLEKMVLACCKCKKDVKHSPPYRVDHLRPLCLCFDALHLFPFPARQSGQRA